MSLVLGVQSYYTTSDAWRETIKDFTIPVGQVTMCEFVTIDVETDSDNTPCIFLPMIERHLKKLLEDGILTTGMRVSVCLFEELCDDKMNDRSSIVTWFDTHVSNLHSPSDPNFW